MKKKALQVLLVEDNAGDARLLREMFSKEPSGSFELSHLTHMRDGRGSACKQAESILSCWIWDCRMGMASRPCDERARRPLMW